MDRATNLLVNITNRDSIYNIISRIILSLLPEDLAKEAAKNEKAKILSTDVFFLHYSSHPILSDRSEDEFLESARLILLRYIDSEEFLRTRISTMLDEETSLVFSVTFLRNLLKSLTTSATQSKGKRGEVEGGGKGKGSSEEKSNEGEGGDRKTATDIYEERNRENEPTGESLAQKPNEAENASEQAIAEALSRASEYASLAKQLKDIGFSGGASREKGSIRKLLDLTEAVIEVKESREILNMFRIMKEAASKTIHSEKVLEIHGEEVRGYGRTKKLEKAIPKEFAAPQPIFLAKYSSEGLLTIEKEESKKAVFYLLLDKSGSMSGHKLVWSRSVALFLLRLAGSKGMKTFMRLFDSEPYPYGSPMENLNDMIQSVLTVPSNGGTDIRKAISVALEDISKERGGKRSIILLITDGEDRFSIQRDHSWKNVQLVTIMVSGENEVLKSISDLYLKAGLTVDGALAIAREGELLMTTGERSRYRHA